jgi:hypothetical protein
VRPQTSLDVFCTTQQLFLPYQIDWFKYFNWFSWRPLRLGVRKEGRLYYSHRAAVIPATAIAFDAAIYYKPWHE